MGRDQDSRKTYFRRSREKASWESAPSFDRERVRLAQSAETVNESTISQSHTYPEHADAHFNLADIYERRGEKAAALRHLKSTARSGRRDFAIILAIPQNGGLPRF